MAMKEYSSLPSAPEMEPYNWMPYRITQDTPFYLGFFYYSEETISVTEASSIELEIPRWERCSLTAISTAKF